jgi:hypothetical protein
VLWIELLAYDLVGTEILFTYNASRARYALLSSYWRSSHSAATCKAKCQVMNGSRSDSA